MPIKLLFAFTKLYLIFIKAFKSIIILNNYSVYWLLPESTTANLADIQTQLYIDSRVSILELYKFFSVYLRP